MSKHFLTYINICVTTHFRDLEFGIWLGLVGPKMHRDAAQLNFHHFAMKDVQKKTVLGNSDRCPNSRISPWLLFDMAPRSWPGFCVQRVKRVPSLFFTLANITPERAEKLENPVNSRKCCRCWRSWSWDLWRFLLVQTVLLFRGEQCTRRGSLRIVGLRSDTGSQSSAAKIALLQSTEESAEPASELYTIPKVYTSFRHFSQLFGVGVFRNWVVQF